ARLWRGGPGSRARVRACTAEQGRLSLSRSCGLSPLRAPGQRKTATSILGFNEIELLMASENDPGPAAANPQRLNWRTGCRGEPGLMQSAPASYARAGRVVKQRPPPLDARSDL